jgi:hypothetical protein
MTIDKDDYELWRAHPVTELVNKALLRLAEKNKQKWMEVSWDGGEANPMTLLELRVRAQAAEDLSRLELDELNEVLDDK